MTLSTVRLGNKTDHRISEINLIKFRTLTTHTPPLLVLKLKGNGALCKITFVVHLDSHRATTRNGCRADAFNFLLSIISFRMRFGLVQNSRSLHMFNEIATGMASVACHHALAQYYRIVGIARNVRLLSSACLFVCPVLHANRNKLE